MPLRHNLACCGVDWSTKKEREKKKDRSCAPVLARLNPRLQVWVIFGALEERAGFFHQPVKAEMDFRGKRGF